MSILLLAGCSPQTTKRLVSDYVKSTINNPDSYVPISFTAPVPINAGDMLTGMSLTEAAAPGAAMN